MIAQMIIAMNEMKPCSVVLTFRKDKCAAVQINQTDIPQTTSSRYLGYHMDNKLTWKNHIEKRENKYEEWCLLGCYAVWLL
jgi:hypothetical protein